MKKILLAPLDWGLGHATRCVPVIKQLLDAGCNVTVAAPGNIQALLKKEFPGIYLKELKGYNITYSQKKRWFSLKILFQVPKILLSIRREHRWLKKAIAEDGFDLVISDNRYGMWTDKVPCIFITHQLLIKAPANWLERPIQKANYKYIERFTECWVPDFAGGDTIAGDLSHPKQKPELPLKYIGPLSRFSKAQPQAVRYKWLAILSGPEPQRTILEEKILSIAPALGDKMLLVRGKPGENGEPTTNGNCTIVNHLATAKMQHALDTSEFVISRCGYTTVMEVLSLQKKAILIPTPGQTEQEYLSRHLFDQQWCYCCDQADDLLEHCNKAMQFDYEMPPLQASLLGQAVHQLLYG